MISETIRLNFIRIHLIKLSFNNLHLFQVFRLLFLNHLYKSFFTYFKLKMPCKITIAQVKSSLYLGPDVRTHYQQTPSQYFLKGFQAPSPSVLKSYINCRFKVWVLGFKMMLDVFSRKMKVTSGHICILLRVERSSGGSIMLR